MSAVSRINYAISYAGLEAAVSLIPSFNQTTSPCRIQVAKMVNKAGNLVAPSIESAQVSGNDFHFLAQALAKEPPANP